jgi:hypothetical protein
MMLDGGFGDGSSADGTRAAKYRIAQLDEALLRYRPGIFQAGRRIVSENGGSICGNFTQPTA